MLEATLIISVYTNTIALKSVLDSVMNQSWKNFEILISEDGESNQMKTFLSAYPFDLTWNHLTQEDLGWRKNRALNQAVRSAKSDYLVFIDGDCVLHPRFMEMHHRYAKEGRILAGKRIKLNESLSERLSNGEITPTMVQHYLSKNIFSFKKKGFRFQEEGFFVDPDGFTGFIPNFRKMSQLKGCNMSFSKKAIHAINGFDEDYIRPAIGEDIDLVWRFKRAGYGLFSLRNLAVQYHLHHTENWTDQSENIRMMEEKQNANLFYCVNGLEKNRSNQSE